MHEIIAVCEAISPARLRGSGGPACITQSVLMNCRAASLSHAQNRSALIYIATAAYSVRLLHPHLLLPILSVHQPLSLLSLLRALLCFSYAVCCVAR